MGFEVAVAMPSVGVTVTNNFSQEGEPNRGDE